MEIIAFLIVFLGGSICGVDLAATLGDVDEHLHHVEQYVHSKLGGMVRFIRLALIDSRKVLSRHREELASNIRQFYVEHDTKRFLVPHGLGTVLETAAFLDDALDDLLATLGVVLVGSLRLPNEPDTDVFRMIDAGVEAVRDPELPPGVHVVLSDGEVVPWQEAMLTEDGRLVLKAA